MFLKLAVKNPQGSLLGRGPFKSSPLQKGLDIWDSLLQSKIIYGKSLAQMKLMKLSAPGKDGGDKGDPETPSQIPEEIKDRCAVPQFRLRDIGQGQGGQGYKKETDADPLNDPAPDDGPKIHFQTKVGHHQ